MPHTLVPVQPDDESRDALTDAEVCGFGLPDVPGLLGALEDRYRNEAAITEAEIEQMAALAIDPAACEHAAGVTWCPRCGLGCCSIARDPNDRTRSICNGGCDAQGHHTIRVRNAPEYRSIHDAGDAIGRIDPGTAPACLELVKDRHGRSDFLQVDATGHVTVRPAFLPVGPSEAMALGEYIVAHNAAVTSPSITAAA